jgi:hypothetical protein
VALTLNPLPLIIRSARGKCVKAAHRLLYLKTLSTLTSESAMPVANAIASAADLVRIAWTCNQMAR